MASVTPTRLAPDATEVAGRLRFSITRLARILRQQDQSGLSPTTTAALATINRQGPLTLGELAAVEQVAPPTITKSVTRLEEAGFVTRQQDDADRRIHRVQVTAEGLRQLQEARSRRTAWLATRLHQFDPDELDRVADVLDLFERLTSCEPDTPAPEQHPLTADHTNPKP